MEDINDWQAKFESCQYAGRLINKLVLLNKTAKNLVDIQEVKKAIYYTKKYYVNQKKKSRESYCLTLLGLEEMVGSLTCGRPDGHVFLPNCWLALS